MMNTAIITEQTKESITLQVKIELKGKSMLQMESKIQDALNSAGTLATGEALKKFDTDGKPIVINNEKLTVKYRSPEIYQSSYGAIEVQRNVYQRSTGGRTYCPLDVDAKIVLTATPRFAKILSFKYGEMGAPRLVEDLKEASNRVIARSFVQNMCEIVGSIFLENELEWKYELPKLDVPVSMIAIGLDGTTVRMREDSISSDGKNKQTLAFREAMVGTISFFDQGGERLHTIYSAATPEIGKETFLARFSGEIDNAKSQYPNVTYLGIADGAKINWDFLNSRTNEQILDFYHATEYITVASQSLFKKEEDSRKWASEKCHELKHNTKGAEEMLEEMKHLKKITTMTKEKLEKLNKAITYFTNQLTKMDYARHQKKNRPIGSGVTEAAAKTVIKERLCNAGMRWKEQGAAIVLSIRCLSLTRERWNQAWNKIDELGFKHAA